MLALQHITKRFVTPEGMLTAVEDIALEVPRGRFISVIGPSGCGKSTLFNIIGGLLDGYEGRVLIDGEAVRGTHRDVGMVFQEESTFPWLTTLENIAFPLDVAGMPKAERGERARSLFGALDEQTRLLLGDELLRIHRSLAQTTLLITHSITEAVQLSDRVVVMTYRPGRVKRIVDIDLPRPRSSEIVASPEFGRLVATIWSDLREEASRGMREAEARVT